MSYDAATKFIEEKFEGLNANPEKTIYMHQTCATDTNQVQIILDSVIDMIIQANLQGCGLYWNALCSFHLHFISFYFQKIVWSRTYTGWLL